MSNYPTKSELSLMSKEQLIAICENDLQVCIDNSDWSREKPIATKQQLIYRIMHRISELKEQEASIKADADGYKPTPIKSNPTGNKPPKWEVLMIYAERGGKQDRNRFKFESIKNIILGIELDAKIFWKEVDWNSQEDAEDLIEYNAKFLDDDGEMKQIHIKRIQ